MDKALENLLNVLNISPVLADIGCSGARFKLWDSIARESVMLGFDPDSREIPYPLKQRYKKVIMIDCAVCDNDVDKEIKFVLTKYPSCSSTLEPDLKSLEDYVFRDYFIPVKNVRVPATSLNRVIKDYNIDTIDWIKIDSQGIDLKIIKSLNEINFSRIVAVDVEPGLIDAYRGEDLFPEVHQFLTNNGFWLADIFCQSFPHVNHGSVINMAKYVGAKNYQDVMESLKTSPTAAEARYLRTIPAASVAGERQLILLFIFSLVCGFTGFAFEVYENYANLYNNQKIINSMENLVCDKLRQEVKKSLAEKGIIKTYLSRNPGMRKLARKLALKTGLR